MDGNQASSLHNEHADIFTVSHAQHYPKSGYVKMSHNIRDSIAKLLDDVYDDVETKLSLLTLKLETFANQSTITENDARLIKANAIC